MRSVAVVVSQVDVENVDDASAVDALSGIVGVTVFTAGGVLARSIDDGLPVGSPVLLAHGEPIDRSLSRLSHDSHSLMTRLSDV